MLTKEHLIHPNSYITQLTVAFALSRKINCYVSKVKSILAKKSIPKKMGDIKFSLKRNKNSKWFIGKVHNQIDYLIFFKHEVCTAKLKLFTFTVKKHLLPRDYRNKNSQTLSLLLTLTV
jgi:hypothetical protein